MKQEDWKRAFGQTDAGFEAQVHATLDALRMQEKENYMKRKLKITAAALLAAMLIISAIGYAATNASGLIALLTGAYDPAPRVLEGADTIVETNIQQTGGDNGEATFTVQEGLYDGEGVYLTLIARPKDASTLLLPEFTDPASSVGALNAEWITSETDIGSWALENGYERLLGIDISGGTLAAQECSLQPDGSLLCLVEGKVEDGAEELPLTLDCTTFAFVEQDALTYYRDEASFETAELSFALTRSGPFAGKECYTPIEIPEVGVRVESVVLKVSKINTYAEVRWTVTDAETYLGPDGEDGLWFRFLLEDGTHWLSGVSGSGEIRPVDYEAFVAKNFKVENGDEFILRTDLEAVEELPNSLILQAYDCWTKETYGDYPVSFVD